MVVSRSGTKDCGKSGSLLEPAKTPLDFIKEQLAKVSAESAEGAAASRTPGQAGKGTGQGTGKGTEAQQDQEGNRQGQDAASAASIFPKLLCFHGVNSTVLAVLARVAQRQFFPPSSEQDPGGDVLIREGSSESEFLTVLEHGSVRVEERGEVLGSLEAGAPLGLSVVLGQTERHPFTVRRVKDVPLSAWCIPHAAVCSAVRQSPDARVALEEVLEKQVRRLLVCRVARTVFFAHCCKHFFQPLQGQMKLEFHKRNSVIFRDAEPADSMLVLVRGTCQLMPAALHDRRPAAEFKGTSMFNRRTMANQRVLQQLQGVRKRSDEEDRKRARGSELAVKKSNSMKRRSQASARKKSRGDSDSGSEEEDDDGDGSESGLSGSSSHEADFALPESRVCLEPQADKVSVTAGPPAVVFCDAGLLGFQSLRRCTGVATGDCIVFVVSRHLFAASLKLHAQETRHFDQMAAAKYQEWHHCGLRRLPDIDMFRQCSNDFLSALAEVAQPRLYFTGSNIINEGAALEGLTLLMVGSAEQMSGDGSKKKLSAPHSFGNLQFLGTKLPCEPLQAAGFCQVLYLSRRDILRCLTRYPEESTTMVMQVLRHNGRRLSLLRNSVCAPGLDSAEPVLELNLWHLPFCKGLDPMFIEAFTARMELAKIVPGQLLLRPGEDAEVLAVLLKGKVCVRNSFAPERELRVPFLLCGWNRSMAVEATAVELCDLHRLSIKGCDALAKSFPKDMRELLERAMSFQARVHAELDYPWWSPYAALRHQAVFTGSHQTFLQRVAEQLTLEIYLPGDKVVVEGNRVDSTMIIESGEAVVLKIDHRETGMVSTSVVAEVKDGFWIGGVGGICGFAGELKRSATIRATKVCKVHRLMNSVFVGLLSGFPEERQRFRQLAERQLQTRGEAESLEEHAFFKGLSRDLLNLLRPKCRPLVFFANEAIMSQGEPADSLLILGAHADVLMEADGQQIREHKGRTCLGVVALLSKWPVKRASTVVTRIACSVRSLSRNDWLEALKHHPEHRRWIDSFTMEQLEKVGQARGEYLRRRAWDKIQTRENAASQVHRDRVACQLGDFQGSSWASSTPRRVESRTCSPPRPQRGGSTTPRPTPRALAADSPEGRRPVSVARSLTKKATVPLENWDCFNGKQVTVPHTRLPRLGGTMQQGLAADVAGDDFHLTCEFGLAGEKASPEGRQGQRRRTVDIWQTCEQAIGVRE